MTTTIRTTPPPSGKHESWNHLTTPLPPGWKHSGPPPLGGGPSVSDSVQQASVPVELHLNCREDRSASDVYLIRRLLFRAGETADKSSTDHVRWHRRMFHTRSLPSLEPPREFHPRAEEYESDSRGARQ